MKQCNCALCNAPVTVLDGMRETVCPKCGNVIRLEQQRRISRSKYQLIVLILLLAVMGGMWAYVGTRGSAGSQSAGVAQPASQWIEYIGGEPRAADIDRRHFNLFEYHVDDTVRIVTTVYMSGSGSTRTSMWSPWFRPGDEMLSVDFIHARLVEQSPYSEEYHGVLNTCYKYIIDTQSDHYGYDMLTNRGYLHVRETDRLLSIGNDPQAYYAQDIVAVAIPQSATVTSIYDYEPYRHIALDGWDIYYYDATDISSHVSIHITYVPGGDAPELDWAEVEAAR